MSRPKAASRAAAHNVAASLAALLSPARAEASRRNGAKSKGPKTAEGKARAAQNALKHGLRAERFTVVGDEDEDAFDAHEAALLAELAPAGTLQTILVERIARAAWRLQRADCIEATLFDRLDDRGDLGHALIRDGNGARAFDTLLRYRGAAQAELFRTLRTLKALQAEAAQEARRAAGRAEPAALAGQAHGVARETTAAAVPPAPCARPIEPGARTAPRSTTPAAPADGLTMTAQAGADAPVRRPEHIRPLPGPRARPAPEHPPEKPNGPEARGNPGEERDLRRRCGP